MGVAWRAQVIAIGSTAAAVLVSGGLAAAGVGSGVAAGGADAGPRLAVALAPPIAQSDAKLVGAKPVVATPPEPETGTVPDEPPPATPVPDLCSVAAFASSDYPFVDDIAVRECSDGWAYVQASDGVGDTEAVLQHRDDIWRMVTGFPTPMCLEEVAELGAPAFVLASFEPCAPVEAQPAPGTECTGSVQGDDYVFRGSGLACEQMVDRWRQYLEWDGPMQGSGAAVDLPDGWICASNSAAGTELDGRAGGCSTTDGGAGFGVFV